MLEMSNPSTATDRPKDAGERVPETLARLERELELVTQALSLLGLRRCSQCGKFSRAADAGALFGGGKSVCIDCLEDWWKDYCAQHSVGDRELVERRLVSWLVNYHGAKVVQRPTPRGDDPPDSLRLVAGCAQCDGSGQVGGRSCRTCEGRGSVWVVVPRPGGEGRTGSVVNDQ